MIYSMTATHEIFSSMIGVNYMTSIMDTYTYSNVYNTALDAGYIVLVIFDDGVVYKCNI